MAMSRTSSMAARRNLLNPAPRTARLSQQRRPGTCWVSLRAAQSRVTAISLEELCRQLQHPVCRLALRMTGHPQDDDAADGDIVVSWNGPWAAVLLPSAALPSGVLALSPGARATTD